MEKAGKNVNEIVKKSNRINRAYWKAVLKKGKTVLNHPLIFYPLMIAAIYIDYRPIHDSILKAGSAWQRDTLIAFSLLTAFILNGGMKVVTWLASNGKKSFGKKVLMGGLILTILAFYTISCSIKWQTRYVTNDQNKSTTSTSTTADPALQAMAQERGSGSTGAQETVETETSHTGITAVELLAMLSCVEALGSSVLLCAIAWESDPYTSERYKKQKQRQKLLRVVVEAQSELDKLNEYITEISKQQKNVEEKIAYEEIAGADFFEKCLKVHCRYELAKYLGTPEALTYLVQENAYVEKLFPEESLLLERKEG